MNNSEIKSVINLTQKLYIKREVKILLDSNNIKNFAEPVEIRKNINLDNKTSS